MFNKEIKVGRIIKIDGINILIDIDNSIDITKELIQWNFNDYPITIHRYLFTWLPNRKRIISRISKIWDRENIKTEGLFSIKQDSKFILEANLVGIYDDIEKKFETGINTFPIIHSEVMILPKDIYFSLLNPSSKYQYQIGNCFLDETLKVFANPNILFGKHLGIFGNTGTGKSCSVASLLQGIKRRLFLEKELHKVFPKVIIFDSNKEYFKAFSGDEFSVLEISKENLKLPHSELSTYEYCKFIEASQGIQIPVLKDALNKLKGKNYSLSDLDNQIDDSIRNLAPQNQIQQWINWCSTMKLRLRKYLDDDTISSIIDTSENTIEYIFSNFDSYNIFIIENDFDIDELDIIMFLFSKLLYKKAMLFKQEINKLNLLLVLEEAHRYINEDERDTYKLGTYYIERLAREGRKFGISLIISSQRPSELSRTVLSQCNSYIIHRITNRNDLEFISKTLSSSNYELLKIIPGLEKQLAVVIGEAFNYSDIVKIETADPTPDSKDPEVIENWMKLEEIKQQNEEYDTTTQSNTDIILNNKEEINDDDIPF